jgi:hypothetical protein
MKNLKHDLQPYYKKLDRSALEWGITIPKNLVMSFLCGKKLLRGNSREIIIVWDKKSYKGRFIHSANKQSDYYGIRYDQDPDLLKKLRKTFIQSYVILKSQKELFDSKEKMKQFRSKLSGGQQEVLILQPVDFKSIQFKVFIRIEHEWNSLFERLAENNVFGWLFDKNKKYLITRSTNWIKVKDFNIHRDQTGVIYYLVNTKRKLIYIGKAENLGKRVRPGINHQKMPEDWDYFKYDVIKPDYLDLLERIEDHTIRSFASFFNNNTDYPSLNLGSYTLVNSNWKKL